MKIIIINGPNINMLGKREPDLYGKETFEELIKKCRVYAKAVGVNVDFYQSNHEGDLIDTIQSAPKKYDGIIINAGGYTHTSIAIMDALKCISLPIVEVHITDIANREDFRKFSYISLAANERIIGHGTDGYLEAIDYFVGK